LNIAILLKNGPDTAEAARALQTAADLLAQRHTVSLYLLQESVRLCGHKPQNSASSRLQSLIEQNLSVHVLTDDAELRGINFFSPTKGVTRGSYGSLVDLLESCDRVIGIF
jgi:sulfur relay (sulfurtransferase) complex TusBCD TusD component (DsrE family)